MSAEALTLDFTQTTSVPVRRSDPVTSVEASRVHSEERINRTQDAILNLLREKNLRGEDLEDRICPRLGIKPQRVRTERKRLEKLGYVTKCNYFAKTSSGVKCFVWTLTPAGASLPRSV